MRSCGNCFELKGRGFKIKIVVVGMKERECKLRSILEIE